MDANSQAVAEMEFSLVVTRCGCSAPESHIDTPCPTPREQPLDLGVVARYEGRTKPGGILSWLRRS